jgi:pilus assembly protein CpaE
MRAELQTLVALDTEVDRGLVETLIARDPRVEVLDYLEITGAPSSGRGPGDALVVAVADYDDQVRDFVVAARRQHPARPIVLVCPPSGNGAYVGEAFSSGVDDIIPLPTDTSAAVDPVLARQLAFALEKAVMRKQGSSVEAKSENQSHVICVLGLKGGSGKTLTASNLGVSLATAGHSVVLLDLDLQFGDMALAMGMTPVRTMYDLARSGGSLDAGKLEDFLVQHESGAHALLAPVRPDQAAIITVPFLAEVQRLLAEMFDYVVIDTPPSFSPEVIAAVDSSTDVVVVAMRDTLALKNTKLGLETLERMEYDRRHVRVVLNRANTNVGIERDDVLAILGRDVDVYVPSNREITKSVNQGMPIALQRSSDAARAFRELAELYIDGDAASAAARAPAAAPAQAQAGAQELSLPRARKSLFRRAARSQ